MNAAYRTILDQSQAHALDVARVAASRGVERIDRELRAAAAAPTVTCSVAAVGERSRGKSTLLNGLLDRAGLLPTEVDVTTNAHIAIGPPGPQWPPAGTASVIYVNGDRDRIGLDELEDFASEAGNPHNEKGVQRIEVSVAAPLLEDGFRFLDTPGVGGLIGAHGRKTLEAVTAADGLLMMLEGEKPMSQPEIEFIAKLSDRVSRVVFVLNRRVAGAADEDILAANRDALRNRAPSLAEAPMVVVNARQTERSAAERPADPEYADVLLEESGARELVSALRDDILGSLEREQAEAVVLQALAALDELEEPDRELLQSETGAADGAVRLGELSAELAQLRNRPPGPRLERRMSSARAEGLRTFNDGLEDVRARIAGRIENEWSGELAAALPDEIKTEIDALWGMATNVLRTRIAEAASAIFADYVLGNLDDPSVSRATRTALVAAPNPVASPAARRPDYRGLKQFAILAFGALLQIHGIPKEVIPFGLAGLRFISERGQKRVEAQKQAVALLDARLRSARNAFGPEFEDLALDQSDAVLDRLDARYAARIESLEKTIEQLQNMQIRANAEPEARRRVEELLPLRERNDELLTAVSARAAP